MATTKSIRDLRESKGLSQFKVRTAAGLTYSTYVRIEQGSGKTTPEEVASVLAVLEKMEPANRKLAGRPFKDPARQKAVQEARAAGKSVTAVLASTAPAPAAKAAAPAKKAPAKAAAAKTPAKKAPAAKKGAKDLAGALGKKAPAKKAAAAKKGTSTKGLQNLLP